MFTGLVHGIGCISGKKRGRVDQLLVQSELFTEEDMIGDSICINGACLTVTACFSHMLQFDLSPETVAATTLGKLKPAEQVNIERALRLNDRLGGHFLTGHIDGVGRIRERKMTDRHYLLGVEYPPEISCYLVEKGSIGLDGVSLTIARMEKDLLWVSIIPHTAQVTTLKNRKRGDQVNMEADLLAKYIQRLMIKGPPLQPVGNYSSGDRSLLSREFLTKHGFLS